MFPLKHSIHSLKIITCSYLLKYFHISKSLGDEDDFCFGSRWPLADVFATRLMNYSQPKLCPASSLVLSHLSIGTLSNRPNKATGAGVVVVPMMVRWRSIARHFHFSWINICHSPHRIVPRYIYRFGWKITPYSLFHGDWTAASWCSKHVWWWISVCCWCDGFISIQGAALLQP